jgi:molybdate transport system substrate-binding protein
VARLTVRIDLTNQGATIGPGKIKLLELVGESGSISAAGRAMGMSYRRAWTLIDALNRSFRLPVVTVQPGGTRGSMRVSRCIAVAFALVVILAGGAWAQEMTLSVAVSLKEAVEDLGKGFAAARPGVILRYNFGASGNLQKQIEAGAPIDLFVSAAVSQMDDLEKKNLIVAGSRRAFARNALTVIMPSDSKVDIAKATDLLDRRVSRIVIGNPKTVPAGQYAEECLRTLGLWEQLLPKLVFSENVRQALDYVARGEVDAGFVYTTDLAARAAGVKEAFRPAGDIYRPVVYPVAIVAGSKQPTLAQAFIDLLVSAQGRAVLARFGFGPPPAGMR